MNPPETSGFVTSSASRSLIVCFRMSHRTSSRSAHSGKVGGVDGRGYLLSCLPLARRAARVLVRTLRSFAARYGLRADGRSLLAFRGL